MIRGRTIVEPRSSGCALGGGRTARAGFSGGGGLRVLSRSHGRPKRRERYNGKSSNRCTQYQTMQRGHFPPTPQLKSLSNEHTLLVRRHGASRKGGIRRPQ